MDTVRLIVTILLFAAIFVPNPYGYYVFSRWIIFGICAYYVFEALKIGKHPWALLFGIVVVINNPIFPIHWGSAWLVPYFASMFLLMWGVEYAGLDEIGLLIAKSRTKEKLGDEEAQARDKDSASTSYQDVVGVTEPEQFKPSKSLKQLYREAAKSFHPDLATDEDERERRHCLMVEVNRAFHDRDEERLQGILREWKRNPDEGSSIDESDAEPSMEELLKEMAEGESELTELSDNDVFKKNISGEIKTILVVANDETMRDLLSNFMRFSKYNAVSANSQTCWEEYLKTKPDLVVTDLHMAGMNGLKFLSEIRKVDFVTPVILFTGFFQYRGLIERMSAPPDVYLEIPFSLEAIDKCVKDLLSLSRQELEKRHRGQAPESDEKVIQPQPENAEAWDDKGTTLYRNGCYDEALYAYEKALQLNPDFAAAWRGKGSTLYELGRYEAALHAFENVIERKPRDDMAWYYKGLTLYKLGRYDKALQVCEKVVQIDPHNARNWCFKGNILRYVGQYKRALQAFKKATAINPRSIGAWMRRAATHSFLGQKGAALNALREVRASNPELFNSDFRKVAKTDSDFENLWDDENFKKLVE